MKTRIIAAALAVATAFAALSASATTWTYSSSAKTITDGQWTLKVTAFDKTGGTIAFSGAAVSGGSSDGVLDLRSPLVVKDSAGETTVKTVWLGGCALANTSTIVELYCDIVGSLGVDCFSGNTKMTKVVVGGTAEFIPCPLMRNCNALVTAKFDFPNVRTVGGSNSQIFGWTESNASKMGSIDAATIAVPGVSRIGASALTSQKLYGDLVLTNITMLGSSAFQNAALTSISLSGSLDNLPQNAFLGTAMTSVVLDLPQLGSVNSKAFENQSKIRRLELKSRPLYMGQITNIVAAANNTSINDLVVYISTNQWKASEAETYAATNTTGFFSALTDTEKSSAPAGAFGVLVVKGTRKGVFVHKASGGTAAAITKGGCVVQPEYNSSTTARMRISNDAKTAFVNMSRVSEKEYAEMAERAFMLMEKAADAVKGGDKRPLMGWSSWNVFRVNIDEEKILSIAEAMKTNGLRAAGYSFINIDDGQFNGRDSNGKLRINLTRFPNGMRAVVDRIHELGFKAGTYSDAGSDTCGSMYDNDTTGKGSGFYGHDDQDAQFLFGEMDFDFIKIDYCGGQKLNLNEQERYTAIRRAIDKVKPGVRMNICRWRIPGRWAALVAESWRTTGDIQAAWWTVNSIIVANLKLTQYPSLGHYNDMDMLEVGHISATSGNNGLTREEERTHFGMWCFMSSPLLLGFDIREMDDTTRELITNPFLIGMNQNDLGATVGVVLRDGSKVTLVKDCDTLGGTARYLALYNSNNSQATFEVNFPKLDLGGKVRFFDLMERADIGEYKLATKITVPAHGAKFYRLDAEFRPSASNGSGDSGSDDSGSGDSDSGGSGSGDSGDSGGSGSGDGDSSGSDTSDPTASGWTYSSNTLTDGQWTLKVSSFDASTGALAISGVSSWKTPTDTTQSGILNLKSPLVVTDANGIQTTVKSVTLDASAFASNANLVKFYCDLVSSLGYKCFDGASKMTTLEVGGSATTFPCPLLPNCASLVTAKFDFPNLRTVGSTDTGAGSLFSATESSAANLKDIDVATIAGPGVTSVGKWALKCTKVTGELVLTNVATLAESAFQGAALTGVSLAGSLSSLPAQVFEGSTITNVVLDLPNLATVAANAFNNQKSIRRVELVTRLATMGQLVNVVAAANNTAFNDLVVYVSTNQWKASASQTYSSSNTGGFFRALTDTEKSSAPTGAFGILVVSGTDKAVFVHKASASDEKYPAVEETPKTCIPALHWWDRHAAILTDLNTLIKANDGKLDAVFIGDSITHFWNAEGKTVFAEMSKTHSILNAGVSGEKTQNVLWRITTGGELDGYETKCIMLMIGTNNTANNDTAVDTAAGIKKILEVIAEKQPNAKVLLLPIFPAMSGKDSDKFMFKRNEEVNAIIKDFADGEKVFWLDFNDDFYQKNADGSVVKDSNGLPETDAQYYKDKTSDGVHLSATGYALWRDNIIGWLDEVCGDGGEDTEEDDDPPATTSWTYSSSANTLTDGQWTLKVSSFNASTGAISISGVSSWTKPTDTAKLGVINLNSPLVVNANGTQTTVKSVTLAASAFASNANLVEFHCDLVSSFGEKCFEGASKMTTLEMGGSATTFKCPLLKDCTSLVTAKFDFPRLRWVNGSGSLFSSTDSSATNLKDIPVSSIAGPGVTSVGQWNLMCTKLVGELVLTNVSSLAAYAFKGAALTSVSLAGSLSSFSSYAFEGSTITNVVLDLPNLSTIWGSVFTGQTKIRRVELVTRLANMGHLVNIVRYADNTSINDLVVYVSTNQWKASPAQTYSDTNPTGIFSELTTTEKENAPTGAFGVLVVNGTRKGVFVHKASATDAKYPAVEDTTEREAIWPVGSIPDYQSHQGAGMTDEAMKVTMPYIEWYPAPTNANGGCMILLSGGAYDLTCDVAYIKIWKDTFTKLGYQTVNLVYRTPRPTGIPFYKSAWEDGQRAVRLVRSQAAKRGFSADKIGVIGMSAGGHLATLLATSSLTPAYTPIDALDDLPCNVNVAIAHAPAYNTANGASGGASYNDGISVTPKVSSLFKFDAKTCPISFHHGGNDEYSPNGSTLCYRELRKLGIPTELHLYADKGHGMWGFERAPEFLNQIEFASTLKPEENIWNHSYLGTSNRASYTKENIWPDGKTPDLQSSQCTPYIEWHMPKTLKTKAIQIIYSGGSYEQNDPAGEEVAPIRSYLNEKGMAVVTMKYRTPRPTGLAKHVTAWQDLQRAIRLVRSKAAAKGLDPNRIGIMGSSAGGHLTLMGLTSSTTNAYDAIDEVDALSCKAQWGIAIYPAYVLSDGLDGTNTNGGNGDDVTFASELLFDSDTSPALFIHGDADGYSAMGSVKCWEKMRSMGVQSDLHTLAKRPHGFFAAASPDTGSYTWMDRVWEFMTNKGYNK